MSKSNQASLEAREQEQNIAGEEAEQVLTQCSVCDEYFTREFDGQEDCLFCIKEREEDTKMINEASRGQY